jgi:hypothetical protein
LDQKGRKLPGHYLGEETSTDDVTNDDPVEEGNGELQFVVSRGGGGGAGAARAPASVPLNYATEATSDGGGTIELGTIAPAKEPPAAPYGVEETSFLEAPASQHFFPTGGGGENVDEASFGVPAPQNEDEEGDLDL